MRIVVHGVVCLMACCLPLFTNSDRVTVRLSTHYQPIDYFDGARLKATSMAPKEQEFYRDFPGDVFFFRLEGRSQETVFLRYTESPTRKLHPAETCLRAQGLSVSDKQSVRNIVSELSDKPLTWSRCVVSKERRTTEVLQTVISLSTGKNYSSIPTWYWLTTFSSEDAGPWLAVEWCRPS